MSAVDDPHPDIIIDGDYSINAYAGGWGFSKMPDSKSGDFTGDLYEYATNSAEQESGPQGLWSLSDGDADGYQYDILYFIEVGTNELIEVWVQTHHDEHDPPWLDSAP